MREQIAPGRFSSPKNGLGPRLTFYQTLLSPLAHAFACALIS